MYLVLGPSTALYGSFLKSCTCTVTYKAVGTIWRYLLKPPQRWQGPDHCPLWLFSGLLQPLDLNSHSLRVAQPTLRDVSRRSQILCKVRKETERRETKQIQTKRTLSNPNDTKRNEINRNERKHIKNNAMRFSFHLRTCLLSAKLKARRGLFLACCRLDPMFLSFKSALIFLSTCTVLNFVDYEKRR